ncbi:shootin-1-like isoform X2 [Alligator sinensis]|nr:shootin-1-like isoform X2 [Alligator sinensis]
MSALETEYEIERSCREQAEVYAAQVSQENKQLKRISLALMPMLDQLPGDLLDLASKVESPPDAGPEPLQQLRELQEKISTLLGEKKELSLQVQELQGETRALREQVEEEHEERRSLQAALDRSQWALKTLKRMSQRVTQDYGNILQQLELEQDLRQHAEVFAHQMLVKQKEANRQSLILMQSTGPSAQLLKALEEVAALTRMMEEAKQEHLEKVQGLEGQLKVRPQQEQLDAAQAALAGAEEETRQLRQRLQEAEERNAALTEKIQHLEEKLAGAPVMEPKELEEAPAPPPPPPPPPPPLPPTDLSTPADPLLLIKQRKGVRKQMPGEPRVDDAKARAVDEMMARIKSGVVLRPARRDKMAVAQDPSTTANKRKSAAMELQGILDTMKKPSRKTSWRKKSVRISDNQLESILQRRRRMVDSSTAAQGFAPEATAEHRKESPEQGGTAVPCSRKGEHGTLGSRTLRHPADAMPLAPCSACILPLRSCNGSGPAQRPRMAPRCVQSGEHPIHLGIPAYSFGLWRDWVMHSEMGSHSGQWHTVYHDRCSRGIQSLFPARGSSPAAAVLCSRAR